jgi:hypothetical protein
MPNNNNPLPSSGPITLENVADAFYLYKPYTDMNKVDITDYYGDKIKYYYPAARDGSTNIPPASSGKIKLSDFRGKRYGLPVPITINSAVTAFNLFDAANSYTIATYGLAIDTPDVPFFITLTNNSSIIVPGKPSTQYQQSFSAVSTTQSFTVTTGITSLDIVAIGGGGGGGGDDGEGGANGDPGAKITYTQPSTVGDVFTISIGAGGKHGGGGGRASGGTGGKNTFGYNGGHGGPAGAHGGSGAGGGGGAATVIQRNGDVVAVAGGGGGGGGGGYRSPGGPAATPSTYTRSIVGGNGGDAGGGKYDDGGGGGAGGGGASGGAGGGARAMDPIRGGSQEGDRGGRTGTTGFSTSINGGTFSKGTNGGTHGGGDGSNGSVVLTYRIPSLVTSGPALVVGASSDGTRSFNSKSYISIINNGTITGDPVYTTGGDAIYLRKQASIQNIGSINGGLTTSLPGTYGNAVNGYSYITNPPLGGTVIGSLAN